MALTGYKSINLNIYGITFLSGPIRDRANRVTQDCHLERIVPKTRPPNWPYRRFYRSPLSVPLGTSVGAPRRARRKLAKGGRTDRWPQITAIPSRNVLLEISVVEPGLSWLAVAGEPLGSVVP